MDAAERASLKAEIRDELIAYFNGQDRIKPKDGLSMLAYGIDAARPKDRLSMLAELEGAEKLSFNFRMEQAYLDVLDQWAEARGIKTRTAALKAMILELGDS